tara:strand:+ start:409 stop:1113 length:705 start_codon:yes stop_codon:yes gene_type:complete
MATIKNIAILKSTFDYLNKKRKNNDNNDYILEPFSVIIILSIMSFKPKNSKIAVYDNRLHIQEPSMIQGFIRGYRGNNREELSLLLKPIIRFTELYKSDIINDLDLFKKIQFIVSLSITGLKNIQNNYKTISTVSHCIDLYLSILSNYIEGKQSFIETYENSKHYHDLNLTVQTKINISNIFRDIWDTNEINILYELLQPITDENHPNIKIINNLLLSKQQRVKTSIKYAMNVL